MADETSVTSGLSVLAVGAVFLLGLLVLGVRLWDIQVNDTASYSYEGSRQSVKRVQTVGARGWMLDRRGRPLAINRRQRSVTVNAEFYQKRTWDGTVEAISNAIGRVAAVIGRPPNLLGTDIVLHVRQRLAMPLTVWRDLSEGEVARFCEHADGFPGFACVETLERHYPHGKLASQVIGSVKRDRSMAGSGTDRFNFYSDEMVGRGGLEKYYDAFLHGVPGEDKVVVDARGFATREWTVTEPRHGPDLRLTLDVDIQKAAERELEGEVGACVVLDPRSGAVLAMASAPGYDLNDFVPVLRHEAYDELCGDVRKPLLNRAADGAYAPGSTFKLVTALAALRHGFAADEPYECTGAFKLGQMSLHCTRRWGHGQLAVEDALMVSCNPFFCHLGMTVGSNAVIAAARDFGLGQKTGIDLPAENAGVVPDNGWKRRTYGERWYQGDLAQMAIGQGMLLVTPLQMAMVAGAVCTGRLAVPHLNAELPAVSRQVPFSESDLEVVRRGMRKVVMSGSGRRGGEGLPVEVFGKTGTAEIGRGETRRKNTWFVAYAKGLSREDRGAGLADAPETVVAVAMVVENGDSGGGTTAPRVRNVLAEVFGETDEGGVAR